MSGALIHASTRRKSSPPPPLTLGGLWPRWSAPATTSQDLPSMYSPSSILPIPVAINGYVLYGRCIKHVHALFISVLHTVWCSTINCSVQFHQYQQQTLLPCYSPQWRYTRDADHLLFLVDAIPIVLNMPIHVLTQGHNEWCCCLPSRLAASHVL